AVPPAEEVRLVRRLVRHLQRRVGQRLAALGQRSVREVEHGARQQRPLDRVRRLAGREELLDVESEWVEEPRPRWDRQDEPRTLWLPVPGDPYRGRDVGDVPR